jgi:hypothetical protein
LEPVTVSVEVLQRFKGHPHILNQLYGEIEFFPADSRCLGALLALTPDLGIIEECLRDHSAATGPKNHDRLAAV